MKNILVIGATSAIAGKFLEQITSKNTHLFLVAKEGNQLEMIKHDLKIRNKIKVDTFQLDITENEKIEKAISTAKSTLKSLDIAIIAHGTLPDQERCNVDTNETNIQFEINATGTILLCQLLANTFENQGCGTLAVITSVAGDRGRQSNYLYGAAKSAVSIYLQGLRNRLTKSNVNVITFKPGLVDTPMTAHLPKNPLYSSPEKIARGIVKAIQKNKSKEVYLPGFWKWIMLIIKLIPNKIFNRLSL